MRTSFSSQRTKWLPKALPMGMLVALSIPAHAAWIDTPNVRDGLQFGIFASVNPSVSQVSNKFYYTLGDPRIYGQTGTIAQTLADKDRLDSDRRIRQNGTDDAFLQLAARQVLTKDLTLSGSVGLGYDKDSHRNYGALWGLSLNTKDGLRLTVADGYSRLPVRQTNVDNIIQNRGSNISVESTHIPDLTLNAYHMFAVSSNVNDNSIGGWHKSNGASAKYVFDFSPRDKLTVAAGGTHSTGHKTPRYVNTPSKGSAYMGSVGYQHKDLNVAFDYGKQKVKYNGGWVDNLNTTVYGVKAAYDITPRLTGTVSYSHKTDDNTKPIDLQFLIDGDFGVNNYDAFPVFDKVKQDRYKLGLDYQLYKGIEINASVEDIRTRNYVVEGEFSKRERIEATAGVSLSF